VLDIIFHALVRYAAPIIPFTAEEVWGTRFPETYSVHLLEWPEIDARWHNSELANVWAKLKELRTTVNGAIEPMRRNKDIGSSLEAEVLVAIPDKDVLATVAQRDLAELCITAVALAVEGSADDGAAEREGWDAYTAPGVANAVPVYRKVTGHHKCGRCWRHLPDVQEDGALCGRCEDVLAG